MRKRQEQSASFRDALWVSRCVGPSETTPLRLDDVEGLARYIEVEAWPRESRCSASGRCQRRCALSVRAV